jgi:hypothetical protein
VNFDVELDHEHEFAFDFTVAGIPGGRRFRATAKGRPGGAVNRLFTSGRCLLLIGDFVKKGDLSSPVKVAAATLCRAPAVARRLQCPQDSVVGTS